MMSRSDDSSHESQGFLPTDDVWQRSEHHKLTFVSRETRQLPLVEWHESPIVRG